MSESNQLSTSLQGLAVSNATTLRNIQVPPSGYRLQRTEYLQDITGSTSAFSLAANISINPALPVFTWLSNIARNYEAYKFTRLKFSYVNRTTTAQTGYVVLAVDFDPSDAVPNSKAQIINQNAVATVPSANVTYVANNTDLNRLTRYLCRSSMISGELSMYDLGTLFVGVGGNLAAATIGELWVEYDIHFFTPQVEAGLAYNSRTNSAFNHLVDIALVSGSTITLPFANVLYNPGGFVNAAGIFTGPSGVYVVYAQQSVTTTTSLSQNQLTIYKSAVIMGTAFGPALSAAGTSTVNAEFLVSLAPGDSFRVVLSITGTGTLTAIDRKSVV